VDQAISTARDTAALARRVVLRTLTVVGGAAAGTALAWCLSTANASADTTDAGQVPEIPVVHQLVSPVTETVHAVHHGVEGAVHSTVEGTVEKVAATIKDAPPPPKSLEELGERIQDAAAEFGERAREQLPECTGPLCGIDDIGRSDSPTGPSGHAGNSDAPPSAPAAPAPAAPGKVADSGVDPDATAEHTATGRAYSDGMPRRGSPAPGVPSFPDFPAWPAPIAPAVPAPVSGHSGAMGTSADASMFVAYPWQDRTPALVRGLRVLAGEVATSGRPGDQPGVTPD
jgi:hypothetical protein